jgi:5-methylcytosine-specific restriction endonuclease McrA
MEELRACSKCNCQKPVNEFPSKGNWCKQCHSEYARKWSAEHPEQRRISRAKYRNEHRETLQEKGREYSAKRRKEHPGLIVKRRKEHSEKCHVSSSKWNKNHREQCRIAVIKWRKNHPDYLQTPQGKIVKANARHNRRARTKGQKVTLEEWTAIKEHQKQRCYWCKGKFKDEELTMDHVIPLSKEGLHDASNIVAACMPCNTKKHTQTWSLL